MTEVRYAVDRDDRVVEIDEGWQEFAVANQAGHLTPHIVQGRLLWDFIADELTVHLYRTMVRRVRRSGHPIRFNFRCDSPTRRRLLTMEMSDAGEGRVLFRVTAVKEEDRAAVELPATVAGDASGLLSVCSWCERVQLSPTEWVNAEEAMLWVGHRATESLPRVTHGICPDCYETMLEGLADLEAPGLRETTLGDFHSS
jgi:hypothetical protein